MKDKIIMKKGKYYLESRYRTTNGLVWVLVVAVAVAVILGVSISLSPPTTGSAGDKYLEVDDAGRDSVGYYVVGNVYVWESIISGGFHDTGDRMTVSITEFVYGQLEDGNVISLSIDSGGDYQYGGDIYGAVDLFPSIDDYMDSVLTTGLLVVVYVLIIGLFMVLGKRGTAVVVLSNAEIIKKIRTWYGMYSYLRCNEGLFRLKDENVYITCDVGDLLYMDEGDNTVRLYALRENLREIKDKHLRLDDLMNDVEASQ